MIVAELRQLLEKSPYRALPAPAPDPYMVAWRRLRRRRLARRVAAGVLEYCLATLLALTCVNVLPAPGAPR
jgi:hypothetical protein